MKTMRQDYLKGALLRSLQWFSDGINQWLGLDRYMKPRAPTIAAIALATGLMACDNSDAPAKAEAASAQPASVETAARTTTDAPLERVSEQAPAFASLYPGATMIQSVSAQDSSDGLGGIAEFSTSASPDDIINHYRDLTGDNGLNPVMTMNQGNARAFAAINDAGAELQVVASQNEDGNTTVQLTWKAGRG